MDVLNRVVMVIAALAVLAGAVITTLVAVEVADPDVLFSGWFESQLEEVADASGGEVAGIIAVSITIALGMMVLLIFELIPMRKPALFMLSSTEQGIATIEKDSVRELAENTALSFRNVRDASCRVAKNAADLMVISCRTSLALGTNMTEMTAELQSKIKGTVEELTGLTVLQVNVKSKYESGRAKHMALR